MKRFGFGGNKKKNKKVLNIVKAIGGALCVLLLLFLVMDNFTLYWFMLFNGDDTLERRQQGTEWYGSWASDGSGTGSSSNQGNRDPSAQGNYGNTGRIGRKELEAMTPEDAVAAVTKTLSDDQIRDPETAWRVFIYLMDRHGFVPNAIIGAMSYIQAEGAGMGTFTYESYWLCPGPDGQKSSRMLDNQAWLDWLDGAGFKWAEANYASRRANGKKLAYAAIGIGSVQSSDVWSGPGVKTTSNATQMIQAASAKGLYWQDPGFQMPNLMSRYFVSSEPFGKSAWDVNDCPGVDPTKDSQVTAFEWSKRVLCGVGYPGWKSSEFSDTNEHVVAHAAGIDACAKLYAQYSHTDEWFYTEAPSGGGTVQAVQVWPCPSCGAKDASESTWRCAFCGEPYSNSTTQGLRLARMALLLAGRNSSESGSLIRQTSDNSYTAPEMVADSGLQYYREAKHIIESTDNYYASCDRAVSTAVALSGVDPEWTSFGGCSTLISHCSSSKRWKKLDGTMSSVQLQPGDILFKNSSGGHIMMWVGSSVAGEKFPGSGATLYQASLDDPGSVYSYFPEVSVQNPSWDWCKDYLVYRCVDSAWDGGSWNKFVNGLGQKCPELQKPYVVPATGSNGTHAPTSDGTVVWPLGSGDIVVTSRFGNRTDPITGVAANHGGNDLRAAEGSPLYAPMDGTVVKIANGYGNNTGATGAASWGNRIEIKHADGTKTLFAHLKVNSFQVSEGDTVYAGQLIAETGNTGRSTGPHLHFELYDTNGEKQDSLSLYPGREFTFKGTKYTIP